MIEKREKSEREESGPGFCLRYGGLSIPFEVEERRRKHVAITVFPEPRLRIVAPQGADLDAVLARVEKRAGWIARQWRFFAEAAPPTPAREYVSGETHWYLGRQYRLKVQVLEPGQAEGVKLAGRFFWVSVRDRDGLPDTHRVRKYLDAWYQEHARIVFAGRLHKCMAEARFLGLEEAPTLVVRRMAKRWGSCTSGGKILLNLELIRAPLGCIEYVIFHELCHLVVPRHDKAFYRLLGRCLPDWEKRKRRLEEFGI